MEIRKIICGLWRQSKKSIKDERVIFLLLAVILPTALFYIISHIIFHKYISIGDTVVFATLMAIIIYTWQTWLLKDTTDRQIRLQIWPVVIYEPKNGVKNIGRGLALNIKITPVVVRNISFFKDFLSKNSNINLEYITFEEVNYLSDDLPHKIDIKGLNMQGTPGDLPNYINEALSSSNRIASLKNLEILINYDDIVGNHYVTKMGVNKGRFQVLRIECIG
jgi:hypothetical protein